MVELVSVSTIRGNDMSRLGTHFYRLPTVPTSSAFSVTVSLTIGCVRPIPQPEYPTHQMMGTGHQMMGTGDVQFFPVGTEFKLSPEEARLQAVHAEKEIVIRLCRHYTACRAHPSVHACPVAMTAATEMLLYNTEQFPTRFRASTANQRSQRNDDGRQIDDG